MSTLPIPVYALRLLLATSTLALVVACVAAPKAQPTTQSAVASTFSTNDSVDLPAWKAELRSEALAQGIRPEVFDQALRDFQPDPSVLKADSSQPEFTRPIWEYLDSAASPQRVERGQRLLRENRQLFDQLEARYGVDRNTLVAVWGLESSFGQLMGNQSVIRSLATLAYHGRRPAFAREQLIAALQIIQQGDITAEKMTGSWAGAMGQTQFIPTTYHSHAVDFDGDGRRDIWGSHADALASAAHYLQASGWQFNQPWGYEVNLPQHFDYALADTSIRKPLSAWRALGVQGIPQGDDQRSASLILPAGYRGPAFVVLDNFRAILRYNNSTAYAMAIGLLGERFDSRGTISASWPRGEQPLSRSERLELQQRLQDLGYDPGTPDGIIGANSRRAIRSFQQSLSWPADGHPSHELLGQLRRQP